MAQMDVWLGLELASSRFAMSAADVGVLFGLLVYRAQ